MDSCTIHVLHVVYVHRDKLWHYHLHSGLRATTSTWVVLKYSDNSTLLMRVVLGWNLGLQLFAD